MSIKSPVSLKQSIESTNRNLLLVLLCVLLALSFIVIFYISDLTLKKRLTSIGNAASMAYREKIFKGDIRYSESQLRQAFSLKESETIMILDENMKTYYGGLHSDQSPTKKQSLCLTNNEYCSSGILGLTEKVFPIYHDSTKKSIAAFVKVSLIPNISASIALIVILFAITLFMICYFLFKRWLVKPFNGLTEDINSWAEHIKHSPQSALKEQNHFKELRPLEDALSGLHLKIKDLEKDAENRAKLVIIRGISHDIITPISQLKKSVFILKSQVETNDKSEKTMGTINRSLKRMSNLTHQIKLLKDSDFNEVKPSKLKTISLKNELNKLITDLQKDDECLNKNTSLNLVNQIKSDDSITIDPIDCQRIFQNLILNAIQATKDNSNVTVTLTIENNKPTVIVEDNGTGIDEDVKSKIFDLDFTTKKSTGTGLGLSIVKLLCEKNNADISLTTELGIGSRFIVQFNPILNRSIESYV